MKINKIRVAELLGEAKGFLSAQAYANIHDDEYPMKYDFECLSKIKSLITEVELILKSDTEAITQKVAISQTRC